MSEVPLEHLNEFAKQTILKLLHYLWK